jgi:hypothetical protein
MKQDTLAIHSEYKKDTQRTMNIPIYMTTAFDFGTTEFAASSFRLEQGTDNVYSRVGNPTNAILERRIAQIEGLIEYFISKEIFRQMSEDEILLCAKLNWFISTYWQSYISINEEITKESFKEAKDVIFKININPFLKNRV